MVLRKLIIPYYSGNIKLSKCIGHLTLEQFIRSNKDPKNNIKSLIQAIRHNSKNPDKKRKLKHKLYSFTPSVYIDKWDKRKYDSIKHYTGLMQLDFDDFDNIETAKELKNYIFESEHCVTSYLSPSGGVKALIRIKQPSDKEQYKNIFNAVFEKFEETDHLDSATKNPLLPLFLSWDPDLLFRPYEEAEPWEKEKEIDNSHMVVAQTPPNFIKSSDECQKTVRICNKEN